MDCTKTGNLIRELRLKQNMTQLQLAQQMGISDKTVSKWERGLGYLLRLGIPVPLLKMYFKDTYFLPT